MKSLTKIESVMNLIHEARKTKTSNAQLTRVLLSCRSIGLNKLEANDVAYSFEYDDSTWKTEKQAILDKLFGSYTRDADYS